MDPATGPVRGGLARKIAHSNHNLRKVHSVPRIGMARRIHPFPASRDQQPAPRPASW